MTKGRRFGGLPFEGLVPWTELAGLAAAGRSLVPDLPAALARTVTEQLIGRRLTAKVDGAEIRLTLTELDYPADSLRLATGRLGDVRLVAENVDWPDRDPHPSRRPHGPKSGDGRDTQREANTTDSRPNDGQPSDGQPSTGGPDASNRSDTNRPKAGSRPNAGRSDTGSQSDTDWPKADGRPNAGRSDTDLPNTDSQLNGNRLGTDRADDRGPARPSKDGSARPSLRNRAWPRKQSPAWPGLQNPTQPGKQNPAQPGPQNPDRLSRQSSDRPGKRNPDRPEKRQNPGTSPENQQKPSHPSTKTPSNPGTHSPEHPSSPDGPTRGHLGAPGARSPEHPSTRDTPTRRHPGTHSPGHPSTPDAHPPGHSGTPDTPTREHPGTPDTPTPTPPGAQHPTPAARLPLRRVVVLAKDVRVRSLPTPSVIPAEVGLEIFVDGDVVRERVTALRPGIVATPHHDGVQLRWSRHPGWGHLTLAPTVEPDAVVLTPTTLHIGRRKFRAPQRIRPIVLPLPDLPKGLRLTGVHAVEGELVLNTVADEWPERLARIPLGELLGWLTTAALTLTLPRLGTRS